MRSSDGRGLKAIALLEAAKGTLVVAAALGLLSLLHHDVKQIAIRIIETFHLDPAHRIPSIFIAAAGNLTDQRLLGLAGLALGYAALRFAEAYGLWRRRRWAEWLAAASGAIYLPVEAWEVIARPNAWKVGTLVLNLLVLAYLGRRLLRMAR